MCNSLGSERKQMCFDMLFTVGSEVAVPYFTEMAGGKGLSLVVWVPLSLSQQTLPICFACPHTFLEPRSHSEILVIINITHCLMPAYPIAVIFSFIHHRSGSYLPVITLSCRNQTVLHQFCCPAPDAPDAPEADSQACVPR